jgi:hypothetical protein
MAVTAGHIAEAQRVPGRLVGVRAGPRVTIEADLLLLQGIKNRVPVMVDHMAGHTGDVCILMRTTKPAEVSVVLMASQASLVLLGDGRIRTAASKRAHPDQCVSHVWC